MNLKDLEFGDSKYSGDGDSLLTAFGKIQDNFASLNGGKLESNQIQNIGDGIEIYDGSDITLKTFVSGDNITVEVVGDNIIISTPNSIDSMVNDPEPTLGGDLNVNDYSIYNKVDRTGDYQPLHLNEFTLSRYENKSVLSTNSSLVINADGQLIIDATITAQSIQCQSLSLPLDYSLMANTIGIHSGTTTGIHIGDVQGNTSGACGTIANHSISNLYDVDSDTLPQPYSLFVFDGTKYIPMDLNVLLSTVSFRLPQLTEELRDATDPENGTLIYNTDQNKIQGYENGQWVNLNQG